MSEDRTVVRDPQKAARDAARAGAAAPAPTKGAATRIPQVAPPPVAPTVVPSPSAPAPSRTAHAPSTTAPPAAERNDDGILGTPKGSMRQITLYVSARCAATVAAQRGPDESLGGVVMRALRDAYPALVESHRNTTAPEPVGPFPAPERHRRRLSVPDARPLTVRVTPAEAQAIGKVADELDTSASCLVEDAVAWRFDGPGADTGAPDGPPAPAPNGPPAPNRHGHGDPSA